MVDKVLTNIYTYLVLLGGFMIGNFAYRALISAAAMVAVGRSYSYVSVVPSMGDATQIRQRSQKKKRRKARRVGRK